MVSRGEQPLDCFSNSYLWLNPELLRRYQEDRNRTGGLVEELIANSLAPYLPPGGRVVEFGAGAGVLATIMQDRLPAGVDWLETDQNPEYLRIARPSARRQEVVELPQVPYDGDSFDTVVSLAALDTLAQPVLVASMQQFARILKPGGKVVHLLDLAPNIDFLTKEAEARGFILLPCPIDKDGETVNGVVYIDKEKLRKRLYTINQPEENKRVLSWLIHRYEEMFYKINMDRPELFNTLAQAMHEEGLVESEVSLWDQFSENLVGAATESGLQVIETKVVEAEKRVYKKSLPQIPEDVGMLTRRFGIRNMVKISDTPGYRPNQIHIRANLLLHVFQKPAA